MTNNIPLGTYFQDGVRSGPIFDSRLLSTTVADVNGVLTSGNYSKYGPGVLHSPQNSYKIWPSPPSSAPGYSILNNVVATTAIGDVPNAKYLTIRGDNSSTYYLTGKDGFPLVQFDWPRVPTVTIAGADASPNTRVTIFGYDWYGFPLQHTYVVQAQTTYPTVTPGDDTDDATIDLPAKAFYQITKVYVNALLPGNCTISVGASDIFGLPYVVNGIGVITSISWGLQTPAGPPNPNPITPICELTNREDGTPLRTVGLFVPADFEEATAITGDVRGLYAPSSASSTQVVGGDIVDVKKLIFTTYVEGEDTWVAQVVSKQQEFLQQYGFIPGIAVMSPSVANTYGVPQFYTGIPS